MTTATGSSLRGLWAPRFDQRVQVEGVGEIEELIAQPAYLCARRQGHGQSGVEHSAAGLRGQVGVAGEVFQFNLMVGEELAQLIENVRAVHRTHVSDIRQGLWTDFLGGAAGLGNGEFMLRGGAWWGSLQACKGVPAAGNLQHQSAVFTVAA